ncbi:MAG TPA: ATP phosphoribosyltransferase regulatory subunit, partial [Candidatus Absconditabacterales bacterium]|nr:ATP phosphoribosyltransferase regulatory subunit [Candidatus Absconditabacterales bacterium]
DLALRPEMTPTVTRMVSKNYNQLAKPIRYFSIANFYRNERPQRGRNREFWQLNVDIFGSESENAEIEIFQLAMELMLAFKPPKNSWKLHINNRKILDEILIDKIGLRDPDIRLKVVRLMDKYDKISNEDFSLSLNDIGVSKEQIEMILQYLGCDNLSDIMNVFDMQKNAFVVLTNNIIKKLSDLGYSQYIEFKPSLIRGFDYYDGLVFEIFDIHPDNNRALFGGGRYNGLSHIFNKELHMPAIGFAPGDETMKLFLESRGLLDKIIQKTDIKNMYLPILESGFENEVLNLANKLRKQGRNVTCGLETQKLGKAFQYADKQEYNFVVILGEQEKEKGVYRVKDMKTGKERDFDLKERFCTKRLNQ